MDRKEFFKKTMKTGACACAMMFMGKTTAFADEKKADEKKTGDKEAEKKKKQDEQTKQFISSWTESLMLIMDENLDEKTKTKILMACGRKCCERTFKPIAEKYKGNLKGMLAFFEKGWAEKVTFDEKKGHIIIYGKKLNKCFCPLAAGKQTFKTGTFCLCSKGGMTETFETVTGKKIEVDTLKSILTGAKQCVHRIKIV
ncbi:MAG: hypothetical protein GY757_40930 [bacterium]|nr:hypothetical protein [bacterium]